MPYLIDGHNLIPKIHGLSLQEPDDEMQLITLLQEFCRRQGKRAEVFFDNAPPGGWRVRSFGAVTARFVRQGRSADQAIQQRLVQLGKAARNWSVVSSDGAVQAAARAARARSISAETFAQQLEAELGKARDTHARERDSLPPEEVEQWLRLFKDGKAEEKER